MILSKPELPPEIWFYTLTLYIPVSRYQSLMHVSRMFHDVIIRRLFSSIKIYFIGGHAGYEMLNTDKDIFVEETATKLMRKSWEMLRRITQDPVFASIVKEINVMAFADGPSIFEQLCLTDALRVLPNLKSFRWIGLAPGFSDIIADCLPPSVQSVAIQSCLSSSMLHYMPNVSQLQVPTPFYYPDDEEAHDKMSISGDLWSQSLAVDFKAVLDKISPAPHKLSILATHLAEVPVRLYENLTELEMCNLGETEFVGLDLVFRHASNLESLSFVGFIDATIFSFFSTRSILPRLTSFRLSTENFVMPHIDEAHAFTLCEFLRDHILIRSLYLRLPSITWSILQQLLMAIQQLQSLEVFGVHTGEENLTHDQVHFLSNHLSPRLKALYLAISWNNSLDTNLLPLVDKIAKLPHLTFLHLYGVVRRLPFLVEELVSENKGLLMLSLNRSVWDIIRVGSQLELKKWPRWKVKFCVGSDFSCDDDAWLFKYN